MVLDSLHDLSVNELKDLYNVGTVVNVGAEEPDEDEDEDEEDVEDEEDDYDEDEEEENEEDEEDEEAIGGESPAKRMREATTRAGCF